MESNYIRKLKKGEQKALDYIVERFLPVVKGAVYKILYYGEKADMAEECINDVFLSVWKNADKFQGETDLEFKKWIYKIAKFKAIDYYRKVCRSREITVSEQNMNQQRSAEDEFILLENKQELIAVMNQMDKSDREIDNVYVGQDSWTLHEEKDKVNIKIKIKSIYYHLEQEQEGAKLKGNWQFKFALNAAKGEKTAINQSVEAQDIKITVESITKTPMSCILNYSQFLPQKYISPVNRRYLGIEMKVKDDLGNEYKADGASSFSLGSKPGINYYTQTVGKLDENATKLILTPELMLPLGGGGAAIAEDGTETEINQEMPEEIMGLETIKFDDIVLELN